MPRIFEEAKGDESSPRTPMDIGSRTPVKGSILCRTPMAESVKNKTSIAGWVLNKTPKAESPLSRTPISESVVRSRYAGSPAQEKVEKLTKVPRVSGKNVEFD